MRYFVTVIKNGINQVTHSFDTKAEALHFAKTVYGMVVAITDSNFNKVA